MKNSYGGSGMETNKVLCRELEEAIRRSNTVIFRRSQALLAEMGISNPQFNTLLALYEMGPLTMGELGKHLFAACSTATDLADRLEGEGMVERIRDSRDRRIVRMHLLPRGRKVVELVINDRYSFLEEVLKEYTPDEHQIMLDSLERLIERVEKADQAKPVDLEAVREMKNKMILSIS